MTTVLPYLRQSRARPGESAETSLSLEQQSAAIASWAAANGHTLLPPIVDHDETGRTLHRPGMIALRANAAERPGCIVAVYKYDRFARNVIGQELAVQELEAAGVQVVSITEPAGKLSRQMHGVFAEYMSDQLSERVTAIKERSALRGDYTGGRPAFGYRRAVEETMPDGRVRRVGPIEPDPDTVDVAREVFARFAAGESTYALCRDLTARNVRTSRGGVWTVGVLEATLRNPFYVGKITHRGKVVADGKHPAIIGPDVWAAVQARFARRVPMKRETDHGETSWCAGLIVHACGARAYLVAQNGQPRQDGSVPRYMKFVCQSQPSATQCGLRPMILSREKIEAAARQCLAADLGRLVSLEMAVSAAQRAAGGRDVERRRAALADRRRLVERRRERARELWLSGDDPLSAWQAEQARFAEELAEIDAEDAALPTAPDVHAFAAAAATLGSVAGVIDMAAPADLRAILETVGTVVYGPKGISVRYLPPFNSFVPSPWVVRV